MTLMVLLAAGVVCVSKGPCAGRCWYRPVVLSVHQWQRWVSTCTCFCLLGQWKVLPGYKRLLQKDFCSKTKRSQLRQGAMSKPGGALERSGVEACGWSSHDCQGSVKETVGL